MATKTIFHFLNSFTMYKIIGSFLLCALFISASAFTTVTPSANASSQQVEQNAGKKSLTSLTLVQNAPQSLTATWTVIPPTGGYIVSLRDAVTYALVQTANTPFTTHLFKGLNPGTSYIAIVQDLQGTVLISAPVMVI